MKSKDVTNAAIVIGWINNGKAADCGETMKNQLMIHRLEELGIKCRIVDIKGWRKHPWVFLQLAWFLLAHKGDTIIFSSSASNTYPMMRLMRLVGWKQKTVHWVIGGLFGERVSNGFFDKEVIKIIDHTLVESPEMKTQLDACGIKNVRVLPNFKPIQYLPDISWKADAECGRKIRFVFLSRIMPQKGCDYIIEAAKILNAKGLGERFEIDFYGKIDQDYEPRFLDSLRGLDNVKYAGFLNLRVNAGYDTLSAYDVMLFPTYWMGEGFAGIFIDAMVSGLPMIATDWKHNKYFLKEGETAIFIPVHDAEALATQMENCIMGRVDIGQMSVQCQRRALDYDVRRVISIDLLNDIGITSPTVSH